MYYNNVLQHVQSLPLLTPPWYPLCSPAVRPTNLSPSLGLRAKVHRISKKNLGSKYDLYLLLGLFGVWRFYLDKSCRVSRL